MSPPLTRDSLSLHDRQVLDSIFNPLELTSSVDNAINPNDDTPLVDEEEEDCSEDLKQSKELETSAIKLAEEGNLEQALEHFKLAATLAPQRASIYNNRAQALRLAGRDEAAVDDLNRAISLASENLQLTKCRALCQRGVLQRKRNNTDAARTDFEEAAKMGSNFAKSQLVEINPYAALCNQMLRQAFDQLK